MKAMIVTDFYTLRNALLQLVGICVAIAAIMGWATDSLVSAEAAISAMIPFMLLFSLAATDEQNGWERFRLTLPLTRHQVVFGRYASLGLLAAGTIVFALSLSFLVLGIASLFPASIVPEGFTFAANPTGALVGSVVGAVCVVMVGMAVALPLVMRFGMTRATRIVPMIVVVILAACFGFYGSGINVDGGVLADLVSWLDTGNNYLFLAVALVIAVALVYVASAFVAAKLYEKREF